MPTNAAIVLSNSSDRWIDVVYPISSCVREKDQTLKTAEVSSWAASAASNRLSPPRRDDQSLERPALNAAITRLPSVSIEMRSSPAFLISTTFMNGIPLNPPA